LLLSYRNEGLPLSPSFSNQRGGKAGGGLLAGLYGVADLPKFGPNRLRVAASLKLPTWLLGEVAEMGASTSDEKRVVPRARLPSWALMQL
jgi:hypothetical protein